MTLAAPEPLAGLDYPRTLREFTVFFPDDRTCLDYLARLRWPGGFVCPACGGTRAWRMSKGRNLRCAGCRADASITAGTIFADTRLPLQTWFAAAWYASSQKPGVSALGLKRVLGLGELRWLLGTHHGGVKPGQLDAYLHEFVFRFNRRTSRQRGLVFYRLLQQAVQVDPVPFARLIARRS